MLNNEIFLDFSHLSSPPERILKHSALRISDFGGEVITTCMCGNSFVLLSTFLILTL